MEIILDGAIVTDRASLHDQLAEKFGFPDYYGRNLDALYDLLASYPVQVHVDVLHPAQLQQNLGNYGNSLIHTLRDAANTNKNLKISICEEKNENNT